MLPSINSKSKSPTTNSDGGKSFFDKFFKMENIKDDIASNHNATATYLAREDKNLEIKLLTRKIVSNTDTIIDILKSMEVNHKKSLSSQVGGNNYTDIFKKFFPFLALGSGFAFPEQTKEVVAGAKGANIATDLAKATRYASEASKIGKLLNSPFANKVNRFASGGAIAGRYMQGDYVGAGMEGTSLALHEASNYLPSKYKIFAKGASFLTDGAIMARDYLKDDSSSSGIGAGLLAGGGLLAGKKLLSNRASVATPSLSNVTRLTSTEGQKLLPMVASDASKVVASDVGKTVGSGLLKGGLKSVPILGAGMGAYGAYKRGRDGDYVGAGMEALSGVASFVPVIGTGASILLQAGLVARDLQKVTSKATTQIQDTTTDTNKAIKSTNENLDDFSKSIGGFKDDALSMFRQASSNVFRMPSMINSGVQGISSGSSSSYPMLTDRSNSSANSNISGASGGASTTDLIKRGESKGDYNIANTKSGGGYRSTRINASSSTIGQISDMQRSGQVFAVGAYQMIPSTIKEGQRKLGISDTARFDKSTQDQIYKDYLIKDKRKPIYDYITGKSNDLDKAILFASMEWASIGVPYDFYNKHTNRFLKKGQSFYSGIGGNKASISPDSYGDGLKKQRDRFMKLKKSGMSEKEAYHKSFEDGGTESQGGQVQGADVSTQTNNSPSIGSNSSDLGGESGSILSSMNAGISSALVSIGNSKTAKSIMDSVNNTTPDGYRPSKYDSGSLDMRGFDKSVRKQGKTIKGITYGEGGGVDTNKLFKRELGGQLDFNKGQLENSGIILSDRQLDRNSGQLENAGTIFDNRQLDYNRNQLENAGRPLSTRQNGSGRLGGSRSSLYSGLANLFGLGDLYNEVDGAYSAKKSGNLLGYNLGRASSMIGGDVGNLFGIGANAVNLSKNGGSIGQWSDLATSSGKSTGLFSSLGLSNNAIDLVNGGIQASQNGGSLGVANYAIGELNRRSPLSPDYMGRQALDSRISNINKQYSDGINSPIIIPQAPQQSTPQVVQQNGNSEINGLSADIITRNPDSIFRLVALTNMKTTTT